MSRALAPVNNAPQLINGTIHEPSTSPITMKAKFISLVLTLLTVSPQASAASNVDTDHLVLAGHLVTEHKYRAAYHHFKRIAKQGCPYSQCMLGIMHKHGVGAKKDTALSVKWFQKAADQGLPMRTVGSV